MTGACLRLRLGLVVRNKTANSPIFHSELTPNVLTDWMKVLRRVYVGFSY
jgi:hypothetical protein